MVVVVVVDPVVDPPLAPPVVVTVYPLPVVAVASTEPVTVVFTVSISSNWFLTGMISFESGRTVIRNCVDARPSTFDKLVIKIEFITNFSNYS